MRWVGLCLLAAGCGAQSSEGFMLETSDCALVNNFTQDGAATQWTDCRIHWSGLPYQTLSIELTTPHSSGSFLAPAPSWARVSLHVPGELDAHLTSTMYGNVLPTTVDEKKIALDLSLPGCGNLGATSTGVDAMADVGGLSVSFSMSLAGSCTASGVPSQLAGGFIITASAKDGQGQLVDPGIVVTTE